MIILIFVICLILAICFLIHASHDRLDAGIGGGILFSVFAGMNLQKWIGRYIIKKQAPVVHKILRSNN